MRPILLVDVKCLLCIFAARDATGLSHHVSSRHGTSYQQRHACPHYSRTYLESDGLLRYLVTQQNEQLWNPFNTNVFDVDIIIVLPWCLKMVGTSKHADVAFAQHRITGEIEELAASIKKVEKTVENLHSIVQVFPQMMLLQDNVLFKYVSRVTFICFADL